MLDQMMNLGFCANVSDDALNTATFLAQLINSPRQSILVPCRQNHRCTLGCKASRNGPSDPPASTGHNGNIAFKSHHELRLLPIR